MQKLKTSSWLEEKCYLLTLIGKIDFFERYLEGKEELKVYGT